jgi:hypothetical protein
MRQAIKSLLIAALAACCNAGKATTIDFATLSGSNVDPFSSYTQFGFTDSNGGGSMCHF